MSEAPQPFEQLTADERLRAVRIAGLAALLSLDVAKPFLRELTGLDMDASELQEPLRQLIADVRTEAEKAQAAPSNFEARLRAMVERELGEERRRQFDRFVDEVYFVGFAERPLWNGWLLAFETTTFEPDGRDNLALGPGRNALLNRFNALEDRAELDAQVEWLRKQPPSEWDLDVYVRRSWDPSSDVGAPFRVLLDNIVMQRFRAFMAELDRQLDHGAQDELASTANRVLDRLGAYKPEALPPPRDMLRPSP